MEESCFYHSIDFTQELLTNDNLNAALSKALEILGNATKVDRVYYWENNYNQELKGWMTSQKLEWCSDDATPQVGNPELKNIPLEESVDFIETLALNKSFSSHIEDMKDKKNMTKKMLQDQGVLSILVLPIFVKNEFKGFIRFDSCKARRTWSEVEISLLKSFIFLSVKALEQSLLQQEALQIKNVFSKAFNSSGVSMFISRFADGEILEVNDTFLNYIGHTEGEVLGKTTLDLKLTEDYENRDFFVEQIETKGKINGLEINFISKDNTVRTGLTNIVPMIINNEMYLLSSIFDISNRIEHENKILELSNRDELTNLYNRRFIYESVEEIIENYKENNEPFSVAILDIDNFKEINDQYGHQIGDCVLVEFSNIINENLRGYDVLGRYGGEEFIILLNHADIEKASKVLNRMLSIIRDTIFTCGGNEIKLTFSAGLTSCQELEQEKLSLDRLIGISDKRMYAAKQNGKNKIVFRDEIKETFKLN